MIFFDSKAWVHTIQLIYKNTVDIDQIALTFNKSIGVSGAKKMVTDINRLLKEKHFVAKDDRSAIFVRSVFENYQQNMQLANVLQMIVLWIGIGTL